VVIENFQMVEANNSAMPEAVCLTDWKTEEAGGSVSTK
jgi:hypothetical protein